LLPANSFDFFSGRAITEPAQAGSHLILEHPTRKTLVIPVHAGDLPKGLFLKILKDAGFTLEDFRRD